MATKLARSGTASRSPRERLASLPPERQALLLDPAEEEFAARGFAAASLNRILARAGMSKGQAYHYISSKGDLYRAVVERAFGRLTEQMGFRFGAPADAEAFWRRAGELFDGITAALLADDRLAALACGIYESAETRAALAATNESIRAAAGELVALGQSVGAVRDDVPRSLLLDSVFGMALEMDRWLADHWRELSDEEAMRVSGVMFSMLRAAASTPER